MTSTSSASGLRQGSLNATQKQASGLAHLRLWSRPVLAFTAWLLRRSRRLVSRLRRCWRAVRRLVVAAAGVGGPASAPAF